MAERCRPGTTHYLGTGFAEAAGIRYQTAEGGHELCHTTSWGVSTRLIGGLIMTHGDDDGLRVPPLGRALAGGDRPHAAWAGGGRCGLPLLPRPGPAAGAESAFGEPLRVMLDDGAQKASAKRWAWVKKGAPLVLEVGPRDVAGGERQSVIRRDRLYTDEGKLSSMVTPDGALRRRGGADAARHPGVALRRRPERRTDRSHPPQHPRHGRAGAPSTTAPRPSPAGWRCSGRSRPARRWTRWSSG